MNFDYRLISRCKWSLASVEVFNWDIANRIDFFDPIGLTFIAGFIEKQLSISRLGSITFKPEIINYLERINFLSYLEDKFPDRITILPDRPKIKRQPLHDRLLEFDKKGFSDTTDIEKCIQHLSQLCQQRIGNSIKYEITDDVFGELLSNVKIYSGENSFFVIAQRYPKNKLLKISIADLGIGIPVEIRSKFPHLINDNDAIIYATEPEVTTSGMGGLGLTTLKSYLSDPEDYLFIVSNNGCVKFTNDRIKPFINFCSPVHGTFVEICFKEDSPFREI
ncbi:MAG: hypothetical protein JW976_07825 [Syntrophaceae bacterium]|nr:hypothetical protein [Syntrophaceae bacterium]